MSRIPFEMDQEDVDRDYDALFGDEPAPDPHAAAMAAGMSAVEKALERPAAVRALRRLDAYGRPLEDTEPDLAAYYTDYSTAKEIRRQRDELADALVRARDFFDGWGMIRENLGIKGKAALDALTADIEAALRKAGRS